MRQADEDALKIYCGMVYVDARMTPSYEEIERLDVYARGEELHDARYGPILPKLETDRDRHWTRASSEFEHAFGREPETVDILRYRHLELAHHPDLISAKYSPFIKAWECAIPQLPCPLGVEKG